MVKGKRRPLGTLAAKKDNDVGHLGDHDGWVIVKQQKVNILVPPPQMPVRKQKINILVPPPLVPVNPKAEGPRTHQIQANCRKRMKRQSKVSHKICPRKTLADEDEKIFASKENTHVDEAKIAVATNPMKNPNKFKTASEHPSQLVWERKFQPPTLGFLHGQHVNGTLMSLNQGVKKSFKWLNVPQPAFNEEPTSLVRSIGCLNVGMLQNRKIRASNLERKLQKAGGLSTWLMSLGLGQFLRMFQRKNIGKFQLLSLTMAKLKAMGVNAVGPRRKLIHAIDSLSQPYHFHEF